MTQEILQEAGFKLINIILKECSFFRENDFVFEGTGLRNQVDVQVQPQINESLIVVTEILDFKQFNEEQEQVSAKVVIVGVFEKNGIPPLSDEDFAHINAAAILFPYVREQLSSMAVKAGIGALLLPPINFTRSAKP